MNTIGSLKQYKQTAGRMRTIKPSKQVGLLKEVDGSIMNGENAIKIRMMVTISRRTQID